jgi:hypothetical protein
MPVPITTFSSRAFNQDASKAKKATQSGPVFITDRGKPAHVLLTFDAYQKMAGKNTKIADLLMMPGVEGFELELSIQRDMAQSVDLS